MGISGKSIRYRYLLALGVLAATIGLAYLIGHHRPTGELCPCRKHGKQPNRQDQSHRFFRRPDGIAKYEDDYEIARDQVNRALILMEKQHGTLLNGSEELGLPAITTPHLAQLYFDSDFGLDSATKRFLANTLKAQNTIFGVFPSDQHPIYMLLSMGLSLWSVSKMRRLRSTQRILPRKFNI